MGEQAVRTMTEKIPSKRILRFGVFQVDTRSGEVFKHGIRLKLQDQPFQVLLMLLERPGEVVARDEIRQRLWSENTFVDFDHSLNIAINKLRDCLGDSADNPRFIETLPRRGYRFLAPVISEELNPPQAPAPASPRLETETWEGRNTPEEVRQAHHRIKLALFALVALVAAVSWAWSSLQTSRLAPSVGKRMLAVLPFENLSGDAGEEYFISGLHDELISQLGRMHSAQLGVIARTSVLQYANTRKPIQEIGRELSVDHVLEGTVRRAGGRIRISVQLVQVSDQNTLWSEQFEREAADVVGIQTEVARRVADSLAIELLPSGRAALERAATSNMGAYEDYLRGRFHWNQRTEPDFLRGVAYFEDAIRKDPQFAQAYAGLSDCYNLLGGYGFLPPAQAYPKAKAAAGKALEIDPGLAEAHAAMAFAQFYFDWDWHGAQTSFQKAMRANPNYAPALQWYGEFLHAMGRLEESEAAFRRALEMDPFSLALNDDLGWVLLSRKQTDAAIEQFLKTQRLNPAWYSGLAFALARAGRTAEALRELEQIQKLSGQNIALIETRGYAHALAGNRVRALEALADLRARARGSHVSPYSLALIQTALGEKHKALDELERALAQREAWLPWLKSHPEWDPLRSEPRFQAILKQLAL